MNQIKNIDEFSINTHFACTIKSFPSSDDSFLRLFWWTRLNKSSTTVRTWYNHNNIKREKGNKLKQNISRVWLPYFNMKWIGQKYTVYTCRCPPSKIILYINCMPHLIRRFVIKQCYDETKKREIRYPFKNPFWLLICQTCLALKAIPQMSHSSRLLICMEMYV